MTELGAKFLADYGVALVAAIALGWALVNLYQSHRDERSEWLTAMQANFNRLVKEMENNRQEMGNLASVIQEWIATHERGHTGKAGLENYRNTARARKDSGSRSG